MQPRRARHRGSASSDATRARPRGGRRRSRPSASPTVVKLSVATASASGEDGSAALGDDGLVARGGRVARGVFVALWAVILVLLLRHREIISSDTLSNYVHV